MATAASDINLATTSDPSANVEWNLEDVSNDEYDDDVDGYDEEEPAVEGVDDDNDDIARRLNEQLWADISKAQADAQTKASSPPRAGNHAAAISTMRSIISLLEKDPIARGVLANQVVPGPDCDGATVLEVIRLLVKIADEGRPDSQKVPKNIAKALHGMLMAILENEALFGGLSKTIGKRKREGDEFLIGTKRARTNELHQPVSSAVQAISSVVASVTSDRDASAISTIQVPLHQVFLFAVTSAPCASTPSATSCLQEIGALIQVLGIISGVQIGHTPQSSTSSSSSILDIGTAVYPCSTPGCTKAFTRLYSLRLHARTHEQAQSDPRPFKCTSCPASFVRNHDLKRHARLHDKRAWRCCGCAKIFSRRDAIKRHRNAAARAPGNACIDAQVEEVEIGEEGEAGEEGKEVRRTKMWSGVMSGAAGTGAHAVLEDGEVTLDDLRALQEEVLKLHTSMRSCVDQLAKSDASGINVARDSVSGIPGDGHSSLPTPTLGAGSFESPGDQPTSMVYTSGASSTTGLSTTPLSSFGLSDEQTRLLEAAISHAASAAQAQAEAEALEEEEGDEEFGEDDAEGDDEVVDDRPSDSLTENSTRVAAASSATKEEEEEDDDDDDMIEEDIPASVPS
jgi:hypothetical protein